MKIKLRAREILLETGLLSDGWEFYYIAKFMSIWGDWKDFIAATILILKRTEINLLKNMNLFKKF